MNCKYKFAVEEELENIKQSVNVLALLDHLYEAGIASKELCSKIREVPEGQANEMFYEDLLNYETKYEKFVNVILKTHVDWIYDRIRRRLEDKVKNEELFKSVLNFGDFPRKPLHYVNRKDKTWINRITQVQNVLQKLPVDGKVVLYGMAGSGKSNLVVGIMNVDLVLEVFGGKVYWITAGDINSDQLLKLLSKLYLKLCGNEWNENYSSIESLKIKLQRKIREKLLYNHMLIILDNVYDRSVIDAFDLGCRIMITTQNKSILANESNTHLIEVDGTFKIDETFELFASCLGVNIDEIKKKPEAMEIHHLCKGHPLSVALFGSLMVTQKESLLKNKSSWKSFSEMLKGRNYHEQNSAIKSSIANLDKNLRQKFEDFSIFPEDVNITSKVLQTLWRLDEFSVNDIMTQLENKSLVVSYYNNHDHSYNYGIHIVLLKYLKSTVRNNDGHQRLIDNYMISCNNDYAKLPDDNYIYQYIGYHLKEAGYVDKFKIYFDLNFIDAKIKAAGVGDLLRDFDLYEKQILNDPSLVHKNLLCELKNFVGNYGRHLHDQKELNLVQSALMYSKESTLKNLALDTAADNKNDLYFDIGCFPGGCKCAPKKYYVPEPTTFVCFALHETQVFAGTKEGEIELIDLTDQKTIRNYKGHTQRIIYIEVSPDRDKFLSVSEDGSVAIWHLETDLNTSQPSIKQNNYKHFYNDDKSLKPSEIIRLENSNIISATFGNRTDSILIGTNKDFVQLWTLTPNNLTEMWNCCYTIEKEISCKLSVKHLKFLLDDDLIVGAESDELVVYDNCGLEVLHSNLGGKITSLIVVDEDSFVTIYGGTVSWWSVVSKRMPGELVPGIKEKIICTLDDSIFLLGFVDLMRFNERILYVMSDDNKTRMFHIPSGTLKGISNHYESAIFVDIYQFSEKTTTFLYRYSDNTIKVHNTKTIMQSISRRTPIFDCYWPKSDSIFPRTVVVKDTNTLEIFNNHQPLKDLTTPVNIRTVCFSPCGNKILYGLENGEVIEYEIKTNSTSRILRLSSPVVYLKIFGNLLLAGGLKGDQMLRFQEENMSLVTINKVSSIQFEPVIETFYLNEIDCLITIMKDRVIKCWNRCTSSRRSLDVLRGRKSDARQSYSVTSATMSKDKRLLAITMTNMFDVFVVDICNGAVGLKDLSGRMVNGCLYCCCFSFDSKFVAFGGEDKVITVYFINIEKQKLQEFAKLQLHVSPVRYILSSPYSSLIFVSVGEQIAWWNLAKLPSNNFVRRPSLRQTNYREILSSDVSIFSNDPISNKSGDFNKPYLLRTIKLKGSYANFVSVSSNFTNFITLDDEGISYHIKVLNNDLKN
nr:apoptotic protease-activating factor 1 isoform X1 [Onthophagus taurus]